MADRPILFNDAMVRAILAGTKTQTRRVVKPQPPEWAKHSQPVGDGWEWTDRNEDADDLKHWPDYYNPLRCPYGQPGDRLWVREAWAKTQPLELPWPQTMIVYREGDNRTDYGGPWKPSIHMPRRFSRIDLEITAIRVERLQEISEADAIAEGVRCGIDCPDHRIAYGRLWESINGPGSWNANPWVWVIEFKRAGGGNG